MVFISMHGLCIADHEKYYQINPNPFQKNTNNFMNFLLTDWLTNWLIDSLAHLLTHSRQAWLDDCQGYIFLHCPTLLCSEMCLCSNDHIMVLPKLTLICTAFLSLLTRRWQFAVHTLWLHYGTHGWLRMRLEWIRD